MRALLGEIRSVHINTHFILIRRLLITYTDFKMRVIVNAASILQKVFYERASQMEFDRIMIL